MGTITADPSLPVVLEAGCRAGNEKNPPSSSNCDADVLAIRRFLDWEAEN